MKQTMITLLLLVLLTACQKEGGEEIAEPRKPQDEYTKENPGEWATIAKDHLPEIELKSSSDANNVHISVPGAGFGQTHYIEKVGIVDKEKKEIVGKSLIKGEKEADLTLKYNPDNLKDMKLYVKCNLHDVWTVTLDKAIKK